ncbi:MAG: trypsin-like peptidase domain-containing protein [Pirellulaceae bacterium]|nr:trypsin-like peptidase domain-containing protein [Planctomycetales bacterium]
MRKVQRSHGLRPDRGVLYVVYFTILVGVLGPCHMALAETPAPENQSTEREATSSVSVAAPTVGPLGAPIQLDRVLNGGPPDGLDELRLMQKQIQAATDMLLKCVVHVQVGPNHGSGVITGPDGLVLTAAHVASSARRRATVVLSDGRRYRGTTLGLDFDADAGMIQLDDVHDLPYLPLSKSKQLADGQWCLAAGHAGGLGAHPTAVIRLGRIRDIGTDYIRTDCQLIGGDSGGPLINLRGELIGIHSRIGNSLHNNIHTPIDAFHRDWDSLLAGKTWGVLPGQTPYIGVKGQQQTEEPRIASVLPGSPAARAGILPDDVVTHFDGEPIKTFRQLSNLVRQKQPLTEVPVVVQRGESIVRLTVRIGQRED